MAPLRFWGPSWPLFRLSNDLNPCYRYMPVLWPEYALKARRRRYTHTLPSLVSTIKAAPVGLLLCNSTHTQAMTLLSSSPKHIASNLFLRSPLSTPPPRFPRRTAPGPAPSFAQDQLHLYLPFTRMWLCVAGIL